MGFLSKLFKKKKQRPIPLPKQFSALPVVDDPLFAVRPNLSVARTLEFAEQVMMKKIDPQGPIQAKGVVFSSVGRVKEPRTRSTVAKVIEREWSSGGTS